MTFISKETQNSNIIAAILNRTQQLGRVFLTSFRPRDYVQMASEETFNYHSPLRLLLSNIILNQTFYRLQNDSIEDSEMDDRLKKNRFC